MSAHYSGTSVSNQAVNVLVHGLIFMRLSAGQTFLELLTPVLQESPTNPHLFLAGVRQNLNTPNTNPLDWRHVGLIGSSAPTVANGAMPGNLSSSVLQFSITNTGLGGFNDKSLGRVVQLPWPLRISSIRCDYFDRAFLTDPTRPVIATEIKGRCRGSDPNAKTGIVTCLEYQYDPSQGIDVTGWSPGLNLQICFEPQMKHSIDDVNEDLGQAAAVFMNRTQFDLRMAQAAGAIITSPGEKCSRMPDGVQIGDDLSLGEGLGSPLSENVLVAVNPANCPNFFVGP